MQSYAERIARIRAGRGPGAKAPIPGLLAALGLPLRTVAEALGIPERTVHRLKRARVISAGFADRVARVHDVLDRATEVLGGRDAARQWLMRPVPALGGRRPLSLLDTSLGWEQVKQMLGRLEHGVSG